MAYLTVKVSLNRHLSLGKNNCGDSYINRVVGVWKGYVYLDACLDCYVKGFACLDC
jgi:hypothetical protein